jgi:hypothetical protein
MSLLLLNRSLCHYTRSFLKHPCNIIFQVAKLSLGGMASAMGLLRLPKMPELKALSGGYNGKNTAKDSQRLAALRGQGSAHLELSIGIKDFVPGAPSQKYFVQKRPSIVAKETY